MRILLSQLRRIISEEVSRLYEIGFDLPSGGGSGRKNPKRKRPGFDLPGDDGDAELESPDSSRIPFDATNAARRAASAGWNPSDDDKMPDSGRISVGSDRASGMAASAGWSSKSKSKMPSFFDVKHLKNSLSTASVYVQRAAKILKTQPRYLAFATPNDPQQGYEPEVELWHEDRLTFSDDVLEDGVAGEVYPGKLDGILNVASVNDMGSQILFARIKDVESIVGRLAEPRDKSSDYTPPWMRDVPEDDGKIEHPTRGRITPKDEDEEMALDLYGKIFGFVQTARKSTTMLPEDLYDLVSLIDELKDGIADDPEKEIANFLRRMQAGRPGRRLMDLASGRDISINQKAREIVSSYGIPVGRPKKDPPGTLLVFTSVFIEPSGHVADETETTAEPSDFVDLIPVIKSIPERGWTKRGLEKVSEKVKEDAVKKVLGALRRILSSRPRRRFLDLTDGPDINIDAIAEKIAKKRLDGYLSDKLLANSPPRT